MKVLGVVFDMDGVLIDSEPVHIESWTLLFERLGVDAVGIEFEKAIGMTDEQFLLGLKEEGRLSGDVHSLSREKQVIYGRISPHRFKPQPGAFEVVRELASRWPVGLATSDWRTNAEKNLKMLGIREVFRVVVCRDDVTQSKPDPEIYLRAASLLGVPAQHAVAVEDSPFGIRAAKSAGMRCIGVPATVPREWLNQADRIVDSLWDLPETLRELDEGGIQVQKGTGHEG